jgi:lysozyme family protein
MSKNNFDLVLSETLKHEGGWSNNPKDPGGATMKGITIATYRQYYPNATKEQLRNISDADVKMIYRKGYWDKVKADELPSGLDLVIFDAAVNSGPSRSIKWLQEALGVTVDGKIGPATIAKAKTSDVEATIRKALALRLAFMKRAKDAKGNLLWDTFKNGWTARITAVTSAALQLHRMNKNG